MSSHRSRRSDDRDRSHLSHKYDKHDHRYRRDDSRDRTDYYHSKDRSDHYYSGKRKHRSRSRSPSHSSKSHSRHQRSRSRSPGHSSRHHHYDDYQNRSHRTKDHKDATDRRDSREHSQYGHKQSKSKYEATNEANNEHRATSSLSTSQQHDYYADDMMMSASDEPKTTTTTTSTTTAPAPAPPAVSEQDAELEAEKQRIQRETLERLQKHLEKEGKAYPPPKPQASHPIFANDGSFLEMFKSMQGTLQQQQQQHHQQQQQLQQALPIEPKPIVAAVAAKNPVPRPVLPVKRRGAKILKTGIVQKQRVVEEVDEDKPSDSWNAYLKEVKRYKTVTCSDDNMTRSLVK